MKLDPVDIMLIGAIVVMYVSTIRVAGRFRNVKLVTLFTAVLSLFYILVSVLALRICGISISGTISVN